MAIFGYVIYQRCRWKIVVGRVGRRLTSDLKVYFHRTRHTYEASFSLDGKMITAPISLNTVFHGYTFASAESQSAVLLVHPAHPTNVRLLYLGDEISFARVWVMPAAAFIVTCLGSWLLFDGLWSSLQPL